MDNVMEMISLKSEYGKKLIEKFGEETAQKLIDFFRDEGLPIEFPAKLVDGITLAVSPEVKVDLLDGSGNTLKSGVASGHATCHRFVVSIDGKKQLTLKSIKIPELDYSNSDFLTIQMTYYCMDSKVIKGLQENT